MHTGLMKVQMHANPKKREGLIVSFPYSESDVSRIKSVLGFSWNKKQKVWESEGPEVLLDMERFGIKPEWMSSEARVIAEEFRDSLWQSLQARKIPIYEEEYGYQKQGSMFLASNDRALLGDDMGLGKSKQTLDACAEVGAENILILCPKTLVYNWAGEIETWHPEFTYEVLPDLAYGSTSPKAKPRPNRRDIWSNRPNIVIANYEKLRVNDWPFNLEWDVLICDEGTRLKNQTTTTWKLTREIAKHSERFWILTGTPLEIRLKELYSIFSILRPAVLGNYRRFEEQHCIVDWGGNVVGVQNLDLLRDRIGYWMLRRTKQEVLTTLPPKIYNNKFVELSKIEVREYEELLEEFSKFLEENDVGGSSDPLVKTLRLQQYCCSPYLLNIERKGSKYEALLETVEEWNGQLIVFCEFEKMLSLLSKWLEKDAGYNPEAYISGEINDPRERKRRVDRFNNGELGKIFLSTDAGQQGLNITSANLVVHYEQLWNPQKMKQREDRAHRIGQLDVVNVMNLLCVGTIDYGKYLLNQEREQLFEEVVEGAESAMIRKLSPDRLNRIVHGRLNSEREKAISIS